MICATRQPQKRLHFVSKLIDKSGDYYYFCKIENNIKPKTHNYISICRTNCRN